MGNQVCAHKIDQMLIIQCFHIIIIIIVSLDSYSNSAKFPFQTMDYGAQKLEMVQKIHDVKCMQTNFVGYGLSGFGDFSPFCLPSKTAKILSDHGL